MAIELASDGDELRAVPGWEGLYSVTADGRVWSHERTIVTKAGRTLRRQGRWLALIENGSGYHKVHLHGANGAKKQLLVHRLVAAAFLPPPKPDQHFVNHRDSQRTNNWVTNLEWCNRSENAAHGWQEGLREVTEATRAAYTLGHAARRMFTYGEAQAIRERIRSGERQADICRETGASPATICNLNKGRTYTAYATPTTTGAANAI